ncbi:MAG: hypothetical protein ACI9OO_000260 [Bacteroidia bacterium]
MDIQIFQISDASGHFMATPCIPISALPRYALTYDDSEKYNRAFAAKIYEFLFYPHVRIGLNNPQRWRDMHRMMKAGGLLAGEFPAQAMFIDAPKVSEGAGRASLAPLIIVLSLGAIVVALIYNLPLQILSPLLLAVILTVLTWGLETYYFARYQEDLRREVWIELAGARLKLEALINQNFVMLRALAGNPNLNQREFSEFAASLNDLEPLLIDISAAPDMVIRYIYPKVGNEHALGLDYLKASSQLGMVELARDSRRMVVAGPLTLVQGGQAIVGRAPVFVADADTQDEQFWGIYLHAYRF